MTTDNPREATEAVAWLDLDRNPHVSAQMLLWYAPQTVAALKEWLAAHPLSGGGVGSPGASLGTEHGEETPTPPPLTVDRESVEATINEALEDDAALGLGMFELSKFIADAVVAELAAERTVTDLTSDKTVDFVLTAIKNVRGTFDDRGHGDHGYDGSCPLCNWNPAALRLALVKVLDGGGTD